MRRLSILLLAAAAAGCAPAPPPPAAVADPHSLARPAEARVRHLALELEVDFARRVLEGRASLALERRADARELWLDTRGLEILGVEAGRKGSRSRADFRLEADAGRLGRALVVALVDGADEVRIDYRTSPGAEALQWLEPRQTAGGRAPFLLSQSQAILARTWVPCQDSPAVRMTYEATLRVPPGLLALMSAENPLTKTPDGVYRFRMPQPVPSYLMAIAVGDLEFRALGARTGVYAEPERVEAAAWELADTETMLEAAEALYGPYRWQRYDLLVLPGSFPMGGMENPRLTFLTPTILAGDRSLVSLVAHELAHSWSGNLVTNATWSDFWLNEGFTTYFENRIMERIYGRERAEMLALLGDRELEDEIARLEADGRGDDTRLRLDAAGRDPDEVASSVAYEKGRLFLRRLEERFGRERWDGFLRGYFDRHAFGSMTTEAFLAELRGELVREPSLERELDLEGWVDGKGLPDDRPRSTSLAFERIDEQREAWLAGRPAGELEVSRWTPQEWLHFLLGLPGEVGADRLAELDSAFGLTSSGNSEILAVWLRIGITHGYAPALEAAERFLTSTGRVKFIAPIYQAILAAPSGRGRALEIYRRARPTYHPTATTFLDPLLGFGEVPKIGVSERG